jgi:hypothetical protein
MMGSATDTLVVADHAAGGDPGDGWGGWRADVDVRHPAWRIDLSADGLVRARGPEAVEWACAPLLEPFSAEAMAAAGLEPLGWPVQVRDDARRPLLRGPEMELPARARPADPAALADPTVAVYVLDDDGWSHAAPLDAGGRFRPDEAGVYAVLRDVRPPSIGTGAVDGARLLPGPTDRHGITVSRWPLVAVPLQDRGSGIDWDSVEVRLGGELLIAEPDPPRDRIRIELPDAAGPGEVALEIRVADRAGHHTTAAATLELADPGAASTAAGP